MKQNLAVVHVAAEMAPFAKVGGLADVLEGLSRAQEGRDNNVTVILPGYGSIPERGEVVVAGESGQALRRFDSGDHPARILLLDDPLFSVQKGVYLDPESGEGYPDQARRYLRFCRGVLELLPRLDSRAPDVLHVHDHHTAILPALLRENGFFRDTRTVLSIHNLGYQGIYDRGELLEAGVPATMLTEGSSLEFHGRGNFLKSGILSANRVTTVSPRYAKEITTPEFGCGLDREIAGLPHGVVGILNGIDVEVWNPKTDPHIPAGYDAEDMTGKQVARQALIRMAGLSDSTRPILGMVTRLTDQKGIDLVLECAPELLARKVSLVLLGSGDPNYEKQLHTLTREREGEVFFSHEFDEPLAHLIQAGADIFLVPSRFEPCGLTQMISMRYGTVPVVRRVGGLADTVRQVVEVHNPARMETGGTSGKLGRTVTKETSGDPPRTGMGASGKHARTETGGDSGSGEAGSGGTGFLFDEFTARAFLDAIDAALRVHENPDRWRAVVEVGMAQEVSWKVPAGEYDALYRAASDR